MIATGQRTGDSATMAEIDEIRAATNYRCWWWLRVTPANVARSSSDSGSHRGQYDEGRWRVVNDAELARVKHFMSIAQAALEEA